MPRPAIVVILCCLSLIPAAASPPPGYYLVWGDEFNESSLNTSNWDYWVLGHFDSEIDVTNAVSMNGSNLVITTYSANNTNYSALVASDNHFRPRYGYYEASIQWGDTNGMCSAFWLRSPNMGTWVTDAFVSGGEIDVCEHRYLGKTSNYVANIVSDNIHWDGYGSYEQSAGSDNLGSNFLGQSFNLQTGFHLYGLAWSNNGTYGFYVDGTNMWNGTPAPLFGSDSYIIFSAEVNNPPPAWDGSVPPGGYPSLADSPLQLKIDYFHYYAPTNVLFWTGASSFYWTNAGNWVSNMAPVAASDLTFSYLSSNLSSVLGGNYAVDGLIFLETTSSSSIAGANTLTLGRGGIDMVSASENVTLYAPINLASNQTWTVGIQNPGNLLTVNSSLSGSATLTKAGYGTLILNGSNSFSGFLNVDTGGSATNDGILIVNGSAAIANVASPISIRDTGTSYSALQFSNGVTFPQSISLAGRGAAVAGLEALSGGNTLAGGLTLAGGGSYYLVQCDSGTLNVGGTISAGGTATGPRTLTLQGNGNIFISASIQNGSALPLNIVKTNDGDLTLSGVNTFTGTATIAGGTLFLNGSLAGGLVVSGGILSGTGAVAGSTRIQGGQISPGSAANSIGTLSFGADLTLLAPDTLTVMAINAATQSNSQLNVAGTLTYGGNLYVENLAGTLAPGQSFNLFNAGASAGSFALLILPPLDTDLAWNTNGLTNGILSVVLTVPQTVDISNLGSGQAQLNWVYGVLQTATNVAGPYFDIPGAAAPYVIPASNSQAFYRLRE